MKKGVSIILFIFLLNIINFAGDVKKYGKEITLTEKTKISEIVSNPKVFEGKSVLVEGTVIGVCKMRGCWIELAGDKEGESIRVKVDDGVIVFPVEAKGKTATVEGNIYSVEIPKDKAVEHKKDENCSKDSESCATDKLYMIKGMGAVIK